MMPTCATCMFFYGGTSKAFPDVDGMCRRYAPQGPALKPSGGSWQIFPPMLSTHWCGDYRPDQLGEGKAAQQRQAA